MLLEKRKYVKFANLPSDSWYEEAAIIDALYKEAWEIRNNFNSRIHSIPVRLLTINKEIAFLQEIMLLKITSDDINTVEK